MQNSTKVGILVFALLAIGGLVLLTRIPKAPVQSIPLYLRKRVSGPEPEAEAEVSSGRRYRNTKEWNITYNEDGLPSKIIKHVDAEVT